MANERVMISCFQCGQPAHGKFCSDDCARAFGEPVPEPTTAPMDRTNYDRFIEEVHAKDSADYLEALGYAVDMLANEDGFGDVAALRAAAILLWRDAELARRAPEARRDEPPTCTCYVESCNGPESQPNYDIDPDCPHHGREPVASAEARPSPERLLQAESDDTIRNLRVQNESLRRDLERIRARLRSFTSRPCATCGAEEGAYHREACPAVSAAPRTQEET